ncbi:hypothetical protein D9619_011883 [Psilocybe cf. subviscida]|uniref:Uncharacterized protein n=1 Tax=Psilocybe cf. subviscida TaxID=2480587 RepID=A0A8H5B1Z5_9AGAR|nr:hypothetical protein D9619_011883 [Psilocybe cf. subviscida]
MTKITVYGLLSSALLCKMAFALPGTAGDRRSLDIDILPRELEEWYTRELYDDLDERSLFSAAAKAVAHGAAHSKHKHGHGFHVSVGSSNDNNNNSQDKREYIPGQVEERSFLSWMDLDDLD